MSLVSQLRRVEKEAGIGERCLSCRVHYIRFGDEIRHTAAADLFETVCATCGFPIKLLLSGYTKREREVVIWVKTAEDKAANGAKWLASYAWMNHLPRFREIEEIGEAEERRLREAVKTEEGARRQVKILDKHEARLARAQKEYNERKEKGVASKVVEDVCAPVLAALDEVRKEQRVLDLLIFRYRIMAEMEVFMWGAKSEETLRLIEDHQRHLEEEKARLKREQEEKDRKYQEERRQREEERRRRNEEWLAQQNSPTPVEKPAPPPVGGVEDSNFWTDAAGQMAKEYSQSVIEMGKQYSGGSATGGARRYRPQPTRLNLPRTDTQGRKPIEIPFLDAQQLIKD